MSPSHIQSIKLACEKTRGSTFGVFVFFFFTVVVALRVIRGILLCVHIFVPNCRGLRKNVMSKSLLE